MIAVETKSQKKDNTAYGSTHLQVPSTTDDNTAYVITKDNGNNSTSDQNADPQGQCYYVQIH